MLSVNTTKCAFTLTATVSYYFRQGKRHDHMYYRKITVASVKRTDQKKIKKVRKAQSKISCWSELGSDQVWEGEGIHAQRTVR